MWKSVAFEDRHNRFLKLFNMKRIVGTNNGQVTRFAVSTLLMLRFQVFRVVPGGRVIDSGRFERTYGPRFVDSEEKARCQQVVTLLPGLTVQETRIAETDKRDLAICMADAGCRLNSNDAQ